MKYKVHWIIDGIMEIEASSKEDAENILQKDLDGACHSLGTHLAMAHRTIQTLFTQYLLV